MVVSSFYRALLSGDRLKVCFCAFDVYIHNMGITLISSMLCYIFMENSD